MKKIMLGILLASATLPVVAESKFSGEILLGKADQKTSIADFGSNSGDDTSIGVRGAYAINKNFSVELAYHNYGEVTESYVDEFGDSIRDSIESTAINAGAKVTIPFENGFSLNARAGIALWDLKFSASDSGLPDEDFSLKDDGNDIYYGIGLQYNINERLFVGADYTITEMGASLFDISIDHEVKNLSLSLGYKF